MRMQSLNEEDAVGTVHRQVPRDSIQLEPGSASDLEAASHPTGATRTFDKARISAGLSTLRATAQDALDEMRGRAPQPVVEQILGLRNRILQTLEAERTQVLLAGVVGFVLLLLMLELLTSCHISSGEEAEDSQIRKSAYGVSEGPCLDDLLHSVIMLILFALSVEMLLLLYALRHQFFDNKLYAMDLAATLGAFVLGYMFTTDAFAIVLVLRGWRIANYAATRLALRTDLTDLVQQSVATATRDLETQCGQLKTENASLAARVQDLEASLQGQELSEMGNALREGGGGGRRSGGRMTSVRVGSPAHRSTARGSREGTESGGGGGERGGLLASTAAGASGPSSRSGADVVFSSELHAHDGGRPQRNGSGRSPGRSMPRRSPPPQRPVSGGGRRPLV